MQVLLLVSEQVGFALQAAKTWRALVRKHYTKALLWIVDCDNMGVPVRADPTGAEQMHSKHTALHEREKNRQGQGQKQYALLRSMLYEVEQAGRKQPELKVSVGLPY
eukprot:1145176-Pelagomonas_calceolata.AAC.11